jgi:hypothetical protein
MTVTTIYQNIDVSFRIILYIHESSSGSELKPNISCKNGFTTEVLPQPQAELPFTRQQPRVMMEYLITLSVTQSGF